MQEKKLITDLQNEIDEALLDMSKLVDEKLTNFYQNLGISQQPFLKKTIEDLVEVHDKIFNAMEDLECLLGNNDNGELS